MPNAYFKSLKHCYAKEPLVTAQWQRSEDRPRCEAPEAEEMQEGDADPNHV